MYITHASDFRFKQVPSPTAPPAMKGREAAEPAFYFPATGGLGGSGGSSSLRRRIGTILRSSALGSACSFTACNISEAVQEPEFVSSRRISNSYFRRLQRAPSLPSSLASTTISSTHSSSVAADARRSLLLSRHRRSQSSGSVPVLADSGGDHAVNLGVCRPLRHRHDSGAAERKDKRVGESESGRRVPPPAMMRMAHVRRPLEFFIGQQQLPVGPTGVSGNSINNKIMKKGQLSSAAAAPAATTKKKDHGKSQDPGGLRLSGNPYGFTSSSSSESDVVRWTSRNVLFSTDDEDEDYGELQGGVAHRRTRVDETETMFSSSRSFSSDSTAGVDYYYCRSSRSNSSRRRRDKSQNREQLLPRGKYSTGRELGISSGSSGRARSTRFDFDNGFRPLVSISSAAATTRTTMADATAAASTESAACSSTTTLSVSHGSRTSAASTSTSTLSGNKELRARGDRWNKEAASSTQAKQLAPQKQGQRVEHKGHHGMAAPPPKDEGVTAVAEEPTAEQPEDEGYAVVKKSSDPYSDFRTSALEMIMERQLFGDRDMERLLRTFLSLNHPFHHPVILHVFSEICQALFVNS